MGNTTNAIFGPSRNPFDTSRGPGGSSGGAAAALAAGMVPLATGSDGGGSIRIPSACCGLSGMKPSLGRVPGGGATRPGWLGLSTDGPMARRIADVAARARRRRRARPDRPPGAPPPRGVLVGGARRPPRARPGRVRADARVRHGGRGGRGAPATDAVAVLESLGAEVTVLDTVFDADPVGDFLTFTAVANLRTLRPYMGHPRWEEVHPVLRHFVDLAQ